MHFPDVCTVLAQEASRQSSPRYAICRSRIMALMMLGLSLIVIAACIAPPSMTKTPTHTETPRPIETATPHLLPTVLTAELIGKLKIVEGCVRVTGTNDNAGSLLVWPPDFEATIEKDTVRVIGGKVSGIHTEALLHDGEMVFIGGGEISEPNEQLRSTEPPNCPGPYWLAGSAGEPYPAPNKSNP